MAVGFERGIALPPGMGSSAEHLRTVRDNVARHFDMGEFKALCFDLGVDFDELPGERKTDKVQSLLAYLERRGQITRLVSQLQKLRPQAAWEIYAGAEAESKPPYRGLQHFAEEDAHSFFGRDDLTNDLVAHLSQHRFLALVGGSGSGKSSVVRAGLVPAVRMGKVIYRGQTSATWPIHIITPGDEPLKALAAALTKAGDDPVKQMRELIDNMLQDTQSFDLFLYQQLADDAESRLMLVVDQFEELFTQCDDVAERHCFVENLVEAVQSGKQGRLSLIITLRADFYASALEYEILSPLLETRQKIVRGMSPGELRQAIEGPADVGGWQLQPGLAETILQDVGSEPGALPLLSHALLETWRNREGRMMTLAGYQGAGGVMRAISTTADAVYSQLTQEQRVIARNIFLRLTKPGEATEDTRRRAQLEELKPLAPTYSDVETVLDQLIHARLVTIEQDSIEVAHEALIRNWSRLRHWVDENRETLVQHRRLVEACEQWELHNRDPSYLYGGTRLTEAEVLYYRIPNYMPLETKYRWLFSPTRNLLRFFVRRVRSGEADLDEGKRLAETFSEREKEFLRASIEARETSVVAAFTKTVMVLLLGFLLFMIVDRLVLYGGSWEVYEGIITGNITAVAEDPNSPGTLYSAMSVSEGSFLFKSEDGANTWRLLEQGLPKDRINVIDINGRDPNELYVGTNGSGVFKSTNGGNTWSPVNEGLSNFVIWDISSDGAAGGSLFLAAYGRNGGIYKSDSDGLSWQPSSSGLPNTYVMQILRSPTNPSSLYAVVEGAGVYKSMDSGLSWKPTALVGARVQRIAISPPPQATLYAGVENNGLYKSFDEGDSWFPINKNLPSNIGKVEGLLISQTDASLIFAMIETQGGTRFFRSQDGGEQWVEIKQSISGAQVNKFRQSSLYSGKLYIAARSGLFQYLDGTGDTERLRIEHPLSSPNELAISQNATSMYVTVYGGIYVSEDAGENWSFVNSGLTHPHIRALVIDPLEHNRLYAGTYSDGAPDVLFVSDDGAATWYPIGRFDNGLGDDDVRAVAVDPTDTDVIYAGTFGSGVFKSEDRGQTWENRSAGITRKELIDLIIDPNSTQTLYAIATGGPIFVTIDGGEVWAPIPETIDADIRDLSIAPDGSILCYVVYGRLDENVQCSDDDGATWYSSNEGVASRFVRKIEISATDPSVMYVGTTGQGVFESRDIGKSWSSIGEELGDGWIISIVSDPLISNRVYVTVNGQGLYAFQGSRLWERLTEWVR